MQNTTSPKSVLSSILEWSATRPIWQQDALRRIIAHGTPDTTSISEIVELCKKEHGAIEVQRIAVPLNQQHLPADQAASASYTLATLSNVIGVNQLAADQTLAFETSGLTVIYGKNGAGKSGYARILKRACRARHSGKIMSDVENPTQTAAANATVTLNQDGVAQQPFVWNDDDKPHPVMSAISVFDKDCASVHIKEKNEVAFRPFGLDIPDDLAGVCIKVKEALTAEQKQLIAIRDPIFNAPTWNVATSVGKYMSSISATTQVAPLKALATITDAEAGRLTQLSQDLAKNSVEAAKEQRLIAYGINQLTALIQSIEVTHSDVSLSDPKDKTDLARSLRSTANIAAIAAFSNSPVSGVGSEAWKALWEAAREFAKQSTTRQAFPPETSDPCLLCHQSIGGEAHTRLHEFERFIRDDIETKASAAEQAAMLAIKLLNERKVDTKAVQPVIDRIAITDPTFAGIINAFISSADVRWNECSSGLQNKDVLALAPLSSNPRAQLTTLESDIRAYATQLDKAGDAEGRKVLVTEHAELADRTAASAFVLKAEAEIARLKRISIISSALAETATNAVTKLGNDIADNIITPRMRDRFQSEIVRLAAEKVRVEVVRSGGQFGQPQYQVRLFSNQSAKVHEVLSEGEQTCVALAAFLAELATASHKSALIFDDPVTSLDHRWRRQVAERLAAEAGDRQIIVFTHDLVFVNDLHGLALRDGRKVKTISLARGAAGTGVVKDGLPWQWGKPEARIDGIEKALSAAKAIHQANDEDGYRVHASHIYSDLRATWERCLEDIVFAGVVQRHRDYLDTKNLKKVVVLDDSDVETFTKGFKKCCDQTEAHDPSRGRDGESPGPTEIATDVATLKDWVSKMRQKHKQVQ